MTIRNYTQKRKRQHLLISGITLLSCVSALFFMTVFSDIPISHLPQLLICFFQNENLSPQEKIILYMRMPTILMTILTGISLSISGGVMQSITHNDLVSPFTLGISAAAAFGASLCIVFGGSILHSTGGTHIGCIYRFLPLHISCLRFILQDGIDCFHIGLNRNRHELSFQCRKCRHPVFC